MKKQIIGILSLIIILLSFLGCNSTSGKQETDDVIPVVENNPSKSEKERDKERQQENNENNRKKEIRFNSCICYV